jgi:uncharacterized protein
MRIIITGGTGLIGRSLAAGLALSGHEVIVLSRRPDGIQNLPSDVRIEHWDARSAAGWGHLADSADAIVNLAGENIGEGRWTAERKERIRQSRLDAGHAVVEAVQATVHKPAVVIQASAVGYYGPHGDEEVTEVTPPGGDFPARISIDWEASTAPVEALGVRRAIIRTGVVLSRRGGALPRMLPPFRFFAGGPYGNGRQWFPWIHIDDEVRAIRYLVDNQAVSGPINLTAPHPLTNREFARVLGRVMKRPASLPIPAIAFRMLFGKMASILLEGQRARPRRLLELGFRFQYPEAEPALRDLLN